MGYLKFSSCLACVYRGLDAVKNLQSTQEARVALGCVSSDFYASVVLSNLSACILNLLYEHYA